MASIFTNIVKMHALYVADRGYVYAIHKKELTRSMQWYNCESRLQSNFMATTKLCYRKI